MKKDRNYETKKPKRNTQVKRRKNEDVTDPDSSTDEDDDCVCLYCGYLCIQNLTKDGLCAFNVVSGLITPVMKMTRILTLVHTVCRISYLLHSAP